MPPTTRKLRFDLALCVGLALIGLGAAARGAPIVTVKARTTLRLLGIHRTPTGAVLLGELQDRDLLTGVPGRAVELTLIINGSPVVQQAVTDQDGRFTLPVGNASRLEIAARFSGDTGYAGDDQQTQVLEVAKDSLDLSLSSNAELDAARPEQELKISARVAGEPARVGLSLRTDRAPSLGSVETGPGGEASIRLATRELGPPGRLELTVDFAGDQRLNPTTLRRDLLLSTPVAVTLAAARAQISADGEVDLRGHIADLSGPISGAAVSILAMGKHAGMAWSDREGHFSLPLRASSYPPGPLDLTAQYAPTVIWRRSGESAPLQVTILPPRPVPLRSYLLTLLISTSVFLLVLGLRWLPALRRRREDDEDDATTLVDAMRPATGGLRTSRSGLRGLIRQSTDVDGVVWDPIDRRALRGARVELVSAGGSRSALLTDAQGGFRVEQMAAGVHHVTISAGGYVHESFTIQIPHRGSLHGMRVDLVQVRVRLLELYRGVVLPLLPGRDRWARWTPRELARHVGRQNGRREPSLEELTEMLELAYWSGRPASEELLGSARAKADSLEAAR